MDVTQKEVEQIAKAFSDAQFQELFQEFFGSSIFLLKFVRIRHKWPKIVRNLPKSMKNHQKFVKND